ncbi:PEP-CTERM/exosortase system-associated acyltransferase [Zooshikella sp. RANM57]|uniref:PEP-CTERM/exosortase system-associated acyltransferase n=1 Tax=Zooshikella sp. RANM57 TaxID=3425863 RepID=UPI003D6F96A7
MMSADELGQHFRQYFRPVLAATHSLVVEAHRIRYDVYCKEMKFEDDPGNFMEIDEFDYYAQHGLISHKGSQSFCGCVRLVVPPLSNRFAKLPIEKHCSNAIDKDIIDISKMERGTFGEISRLAVRSQFRRRNTDAKTPSGAPPTKSSFQENERRHFPQLAVALYLTGAAIAMLNNIRHVFAMMEPRLAKHMNYQGIMFQQIGPAVDYHGIRAPYYINDKALFESLPPVLHTLYTAIYEELREQFSPELSVHNLSHQEEITHNHLYGSK